MCRDESVNADHTSGTHTIAISGTATYPFAGRWSGNHVITACQGTGSLPGSLVPMTPFTTPVSPPSDTVPGYGVAALREVQREGSAVPTG